jgi:hypothetical protein
MDSISANELGDVLTLAQTWQKGDSVVVPSFKQLILREGGVDVYSEHGIISVPVTTLTLREPVAVDKAAVGAWHGTRRGAFRLSVDIGDGFVRFIEDGFGELTLATMPVEGFVGSSWDIRSRTEVPEEMRRRFTDDLRISGGFSGDPTVSGQHSGVHVYPSADGTRMFATDNLGAASAASVPFDGPDFVIPHQLAARSGFLSPAIPVVDIIYGEGSQVTLVREDGASCSFEDIGTYDKDWWCEVLPGYTSGDAVVDGFGQVISSLRRLANADANTSPAVTMTVKDGLLMVRLAECKLADAVSTFPCQLADASATFPMLQFNRAMTSATHFNLTEELLVTKRGRVSAYCTTQ